MSNVRPYKTLAEATTIVGREFVLIKGDHKGQRGVALQDEGYVVCFGFENGSVAYLYKDRISDWLTEARGQTISTCDQALRDKWVASSKRWAAEANRLSAQMTQESDARMAASDAAAEAEKQAIVSTLSYKASVSRELKRIIDRN